MNEPPRDAALTALMQEVGGLAEDAGHAILEIYETRFAVTEKDDRSPLTEADLAAHRVIAQGLRDIAPEWPVLSEEGQDVPFERRKQWRTYWLIDPLDGTREFVKRTGEFTVNIALIHDHEPLMGVVWSPVLQRLYAGHAGGGAIRRDGMEAPRTIEVARDRIDSERPLVAGSRFARGRATQGCPGTPGAARAGEPGQFDEALHGGRGGRGHLSAAGADQRVGYRRRARGREGRGRACDGSPWAGASLQHEGEHAQPRVSGLRS